MVNSEENWVSSTRTGILALDSAKRAVLQDVARLDTGDHEVADYQDFVAYLNSRIITYCTELEQKTGPAALADLPCLSNPLSQSIPNPASELESISSGSTKEERSDAMEDSFINALGAFDEMLLQEEEKMSSRIPSKRESGGGGDNGSGKSGIGGKGSLQQDSSASRGIPGSEGIDKTAGSDGELSEKAGGATEGETGTNGRAGGATEGETGTNGRAGGDAGGQSGAVGSASGNRSPPVDDDIVARQLREAAERETEPELKKKLWEEYWKYKGK